MRSPKLLMALMMIAMIICGITGISQAGSVFLSAEPPGGGASGLTVNAATGPVPLILDDGSRENAIGLTAGGQFLWLNRFTPVASDFPFQLEQVQIFFGGTDYVNVGELVDIYVYEDTDGDADPGTGAVLVGSYLNAAIQVLDDWSIFDLTTPLSLNGPGDVLIAVVNRTAGVVPGTYPAAMDQTASQGRSWIGLYSASPPDPPTLPADNIWDIIDNLGFSGNWMIRGVGGPLAAASIPTLSEMGMIFFSIILLASAVIFLKRRKQTI